MESTSPPPSRKLNGCLVFLALLLALLIIGGIVIYHLALRTPLPYRVLASMIEKADPNLKITGITGSFNTGIGIDSITWGQDPENRSEVIGLGLKYTASNDGTGKYRFVVHEVGVQKAQFDLADFGSGATTSSTATPASPAAGPQPALGSVEIEHVNIENVLITNRVTKFRLSIPKIEWTGFKWTPTSCDPGTLLVESDRLAVHTIAGRSVMLDGQNVTFQKTFDGTALPTLHPAIKQPIPFMVDVGYEGPGKVRGCHFNIAEGKAEWNSTADGGGSLHIRQLDLAAFLDGQKIFGEQAADFPSDITLSAVATSGFSDGHGTVKITGGNFRLGAATFQIEPVEFTTAEQSRVKLQAADTTDAGKIIWSVPLANLGKEYHPHLASPGMKPEDIIARVFAGKAYEELTPEEKKAVDDRKQTYFPTPEQ
jgi:hypothetical protein